MSGAGSHPHPFQLALERLLLGRLGLFFLRQARRFLAEPGDRLGIWVLSSDPTPLCPALRDVVLSIPSRLIGLRFPVVMMGNPMDSDLDQILALQLTIAWAGEGLCQPARLGWWRTDLVDEAGGGDLFARLTPRLRRWSALEAARETARRIDEQKRREVAQPEKVRTLFHLGFRFDERLATRLSVLEASGTPPEEALPFPLDLKTEFSRESLAEVLGGLFPGVKVATVLGGREITGEAPSEPVTLAPQLAAALVPFAERYPMPFARASA